MWNYYSLFGLLCTSINTANGFLVCVVVHNRIGIRRHPTLCVLVWSWPIWHWGSKRETPPCEILQWVLLHDNLGDFPFPHLGGVCLRLCELGLGIRDFGYSHGSRKYHLLHGYTILQTQTPQWQSFDSTCASAGCINPETQSSGAQWWEPTSWSSW